MSNVKIIVYDFFSFCVVMHGSTIDVNQMQPQGKKRRLDWDTLDLNESGSGNSGSIGVVESKISNLVANGKECERNRKNVNGGK